MRIAGEPRATAFPRDHRSTALVASQPRAGSGYEDVDGVSNPDEYIRRLDIVGRTAFWQSVKRRILQLMQLGPGAAALDVGCGTGDAVRAMGQLVQPEGRACGLDSSATMIAEARRRHERSGLPVAFYTGDAQSLPFDDGSFDACAAERVLQHLADPARACSEMARVLRPGGRMVAVEPDYGTLLVAGADGPMTRAILDARRAHFRQGSIGRALPRLLRLAGLESLSATLARMESRDFAQDASSGVLAKYAAAARASGCISPRDEIQWLADLGAAAQRGRYRHAITVFVVSGAKPHDRTAAVMGSTGVGQPST